MKIHFVRHGESFANTQHVIANRDQPFPLTPLGEQQARELGEQLALEPVRCVVHSPVPRAAQTARIVAQQLAVPAEPADWLREGDCGEMEGRSDPATWEMHRGLLRAWLVEGHWEMRALGGESLLDMRSRFEPGLAALCRRFDDDLGDLVLVGHAAIFACILPLVLANVDHRFAWSHPLRKTGRVIAAWAPPGLRCLEWDGICLDAKGVA